jgi:putative flippase GtrA
VSVPFHFEDRRFGESKLTLKQQLLYLQHLRRLYIYKFSVWSQLVQFLVVGSSGVAVNLTLLTAFVHSHTPLQVSVAAAIVVSMCSNFILNRRFSFSFARREPWFRQFASFLGASVLGAVVNYTLTLAALQHLPLWRPQAASLIGIAAGDSIQLRCEPISDFSYLAHLRECSAEVSCRHLTMTPKATAIKGIGQTVLLLRSDVALHSGLVQSASP